MTDRIVLNNYNMVKKKEKDNDHIIDEEIPKSKDNYAKQLIVII
jgi:hypothetical protein